MKLEIQLFGGRGASSSTRQESLFIVQNNESKKITFNGIQKGDTFKLKTDRGEVYNLKVGSKMNADGIKSYYVEGTIEGKSGTYIGSLVSDKTFENAKATSKQFMIPLSRTESWRRK